MSEIKVDAIGPRVDNGTLTIGAAGDTVNIAGTAGTGFPAGTTINNNADNKVITGSGTAGTLNGETNFIYNGTIVGAGAAGASADLGSGIHIKTADSGASSVDSNADQLVIERNANSGLSIISANGSNGAIAFGDPQDDNIGKIEYQHANNSMNFVTNASEKMRIASGGDFMIGTTSPNARFHVTRSDNGTTAYVHATNASYGVNNLQSAVNRFTANNSYRFFYCVNSDNVKMQVIDSGAVQNAPNSYGGISDERTKQDITDASSQWEDIKALKVRKYKLKCDVALDGENAQSQIGVVSQELEASGMSGLVLESDSTAQDVKLHSDFGSIDDEGVFTQGQKVKAVKYSVLYMKAIKCLQEAITKIETLETENTDIKARLTALENA